MILQSEATYGIFALSRENNCSFTACTSSVTQKSSEGGSRKCAALIWMGAGLTLLLAADVAWLLLGNKSGSSEPHPKPSVTQQVMPRQDTEYLESKLNSPSRKEQMQAFIAELRSSPPTQRILPVGVTVKLRAETFRSSNGFGSVAAVVSDQESYIVHVAWEGDKWLIIYTEEVRGS